MNHSPLRGFSLIEILIAVFIIATSMMFIIPWVQKSENDTKNNLRKLQAINKALYSYSRIYNKSYRLVLSTKDNQSSFWAESEQPLPWDTSERLNDNSISDLDQKGVSSLFKKDKEITKEIFLPQNIYFDWPDKSEDQLYILYHSQSLSPAVQVILKDASRELWTLNFKPIIGALDIQSIIR